MAVYFQLGDAVTHRDGDKGRVIRIHGPCPSSHGKQLAYICSLGSRYAICCASDLQFDDNRSELSEGALFAADVTIAINDAAGRSSISKGLQTTIIAGVLGKAIADNWPVETQEEVVRLAASALHQAVASSAMTARSTVKTEGRA
ncbi:hypothetical protein [Zavarzinia aquatilis]|uniref:Uncharacterized protein n=1 Tax=Zavarzinia aquatilis TaxID=2211142 RepID=A0A317DV17_9PROT|nr:hypothetical protein [Zavarzinia aquatilis]PWR17706.1 hypothetical protein DKG74_20680 [Zavarzinia aquatilis]